MKFFDTNALFNIDLSKENFFIISSVTLEELESIKTNKNKTDELRFQARKVSHWLDENPTKYNVIIYNSLIESLILERKIEITPDAKIAATAYAIKQQRYDEDEFIFVTNDICCKNIARQIFELKVESVKYNDKEYKGFKDLVMSDGDMAYFYENLNINQFDLFTNEYLIIRNKENEIVDKMKWTGQKFESVQYRTLRSNFYGTVKPYEQDIYQQLVLDSLIKNQITMIKGPAGTGKSYLALGTMFYLLEQHDIDKIVMFVNPTPTANSAKLGFLPGTQLEKLIDSSVGNMLAGKLGEKYAIDNLVSQGKLDILPMCDIRGFDTTGLNCAVYITEAQNMDISLMKLALQRIGSDSKCIIDGDYNAQVDLSQYAGNNNGMRRMSEVFRGYDFYGEVELQNIYRSRIAQVAELM